MARIRSVKPEMRTSDDVCQWPFEVRYFFVLLWGYLDDRGRGLDLPKAIAGDCYPKDEKVTPAVVDKWLTLMGEPAIDTEPPPVCRYTVGGKRYVHCPNWSKHQRINRPTPSRLPPCPTHDNAHESLTQGLLEGLTESPLSGSVPGAAEVGTGEVGAAAPRGEPPPQTPRDAAAAKIIQDTTGCTLTEAVAVTVLVRAERKPRNLPGLVKRMADDHELADWLARVRAAQADRDVARTIAAARQGPPCDHGDPGGATLHPITGEPLCPQCRTGRRHAA